MIAGEILAQSWDALRRNPTRSLLTMTGIVWGIVAVTLLMSYGSGFRFVLVRAFEAFGKAAIVCWPGQTSQQAGGERAGKPVHFEQDDVNAIRQEATLVKYACLETVRRPDMRYGERLVTGAVRGVCPEYGEMRHEVPSVGRWISAEDMQERRRVVFLGEKLRNRLFSGQQAVGETVTIQGVRFTVIGIMDTKMQLSNYFSSDDESAFIPYSTAGELWNTRYGSVMVFEPVAPPFEKAAMEQVRTVMARRQNYVPTDQRAIQMFGRSSTKPIIDGITIGLQVLLLFIGALTLGIGGVGVMNIMLVTVDERVREIGLRMALGAKRRHIRLQFLLEALVLTAIGGVVGIALAYGIAAAVGPMPLLTAIFNDDPAAPPKGDLKLQIDLMTVLVSSGVLVVVGVMSGFLPAMRASRMDPVTALRYE